MNILIHLIFFKGEKVRHKILKRLFRDTEIIWDWNSSMITLKSVVCTYIYAFMYIYVCTHTHYVYVRFLSEALFEMTSLKNKA